ncbi:MAG: DUF2283 domain-containing protein [Candidatus Omnitrophica bacterium]|nr:DUF2283 domain-containing protein [Candidatus Omnitrophota bacterium]
MKINYYSDTDSIYIDLSSRPSVETREISSGVNLDYDSNGEIVGIDIDNASRKMDLKDLFLSHIPAQVHILSA